MVGIEPVRVLGTRRAIGVPERCRLQQSTSSSDSKRIYARVTGLGSIPVEGVAAVAVNVTALGSNAPSRIRIWGPGEGKSDIVVKVPMNKDASGTAIVPVANDGTIALANAVGNGVADSKAAYCFVPDMIRFYLNEQPSLEQISTYRCGRPDELAYVLDHLEELVIKEVDGAGGYGMLIGPRATRAEIEDFGKKLRAHPDGFVAQPLIELSTCPTWAGSHTAPRRVDLRPYVITGANGRWALPGGLTRVALVEGSYVVNSSQGGGSKDTWVLEGGTP